MPPCPQSTSALTALSQPSPHTRLATIDLGSNSFHLLIAETREGRLQLVARHGVTVQLGAGLDDVNHLDEATLQRALTGLARFLPLLKQVDRRYLRVVGTSALRAAHNRQTFITRAEALLDCRVEIISGEEEARLIYLGAAQALNRSDERRLVVDIGGGSTECIIGSQLQPLLMRSLNAGCVSHTRRHFAEGTLSEAGMRQIEKEVRLQLEPAQGQYRQLGWHEALGTSGTIKATAAVLAATGEPPGLINRDALLDLRQRVIACGQLDRVKLPGLTPDRSHIFPAGIAILCAIFAGFGLSSLRYADGALREGALYDMLERDPLLRR